MTSPTFGIRMKSKLAKGSSGSCAMRARMRFYTLIILVFPCMSKVLSVIHARNLTTISGKSASVRAVRVSTAQSG
jgi:hypothetical protein